MTLFLVRWGLLNHIFFPSCKEINHGLFCYPHRMQCVLTKASCCGLGSFTYCSLGIWWSTHWKNWPNRTDIYLHSILLRCHKEATLISFLIVTTNIIIIIICCYFILPNTTNKNWVFCHCNNCDVNLVSRSGLTLLTEMKLSKLLFKYLCSPKMRWVNQSVVYIWVNNGNKFVTFNTGLHFCIFSSDLCNSTAYFSSFFCV